MMKVFARFNQVQDHEKLVQALIKERRLRQRIEELKDFQRRGFTNLDQLEAELAGRRKKEDKAERRQDKAERTEFLSRGKVSRP
jgi:transcriptional adapter 2-alpha